MYDKLKVFTLSVTMMHMIGMHDRQIASGFFFVGMSR